MVNHHCSTSAPQVITQLFNKSKFEENLLSSRFYSDCRARRRHIKTLERRYRRTMANTDRAACMREQLAVHRFFKKNLWCGRVYVERGNSKKLWQSLFRLINVNNSSSTDNTAKSTKLKCLTSGYPSWVICSTLQVHAGIKFLWSSNCKTCGLHPVPTRIVKKLAQILVLFITQLFNKSMFDGVFPDAFKRTIVILIIPLL